MVALNPYGPGHQKLIFQSADTVVVLCVEFQILAQLLYYFSVKNDVALEKIFVLEMRHDCLRSRLCILSLGATVYNLWKHRNDILHGNVLSLGEMIIAKIKGEVRARIMAKGPYKSLP
jgi:hypothetical protein